MDKYTEIAATLQTLREQHKRAQRQLVEAANAVVRCDAALNELEQSGDHRTYVPAGRAFILISKDELRKEVEREKEAKQTTMKGLMEVEDKLLKKAQECEQAVRDAKAAEDAVKKEGGSGV